MNSIALRHRLAAYTFTWLAFGIGFLFVTTDGFQEGFTANLVQMVSLLPFMFSLGFAKGMAPDDWYHTVFWLAGGLLALHAVLVLICRSRRSTLALWLCHVVASVMSLRGIQAFVDDLLN